MQTSVVEYYCLLGLWHVVSCQFIIILITRCMCVSGSENRTTDGVCAKYVMQLCGCSGADVLNLILIS